jgi:hypothetical protein
MLLLFRLPLILIETAFRQGATVLEGVTRLVRGEAVDDLFVAPRPTRTPSSEPTGDTEERPVDAEQAPQGAPPAEDAQDPRVAATRPRQGPPPPTAAEAIARRRAREAAAPAPAPAPPARGRETPPQPRTPRPTAAAPGPAPVTPLPPLDAEDHVDREATVVESFGAPEDVSATVRVDPPWDGYDSMPALAVIERVRAADEATKAIVRLYEAQHKNRRTVLAATAR